jgi:hypothetical protein
LRDRTRGVRRRGPRCGGPQRAGSDPALDGQARCRCRWWGLLLPANRPKLAVATTGRLEAPDGYSHGRRRARFVIGHYRLYGTQSGGGHAFRPDPHSITDMSMYARAFHSSPSCCSRPVRSDMRPLKRIAAFPTLCRHVSLSIDQSKPQVRHGSPKRDRL